jgi:HK97 gp10 family phage protein
MSVITIAIEGREQLIHELRALAGPELKRVASRSVRTAMRPVLVAAQAGVPVESGRLRTSLGQLSVTSSRGGFVSSRVGPRRDFTYRSSAGNKLVSGHGKKRDKAIAKGFAQDRTTAQQYASLIEFGTDRSGRVRRKAGGAHFLESAIASQQAHAIETVASELRRHIETMK